MGAQFKMIFRECKSGTLSSNSVENVNTKLTTSRRFASESTSVEASDSGGGEAFFDAMVGLSGFRSDSSLSFGERQGAARTESSQFSQLRASNE